MPFLTFGELFDMVIMTLATGYIFSGSLAHAHRRREGYDPIAHYQQLRAGFDLEAIKFAMLVTAPALILHELGHKFVAMAFGLLATFHAAYFWLVFGVMLKYFGSNFVFFVPAYVSHGGGTVLQGLFISLSGPAVNGVLWLLSWAAVRYHQIPHRWIPAAMLTSKINMFLFIFNMLPIPGFDGFHTYRAIWQLVA